MTTFDDIGCSRTNYFGIDWVAFFNGKNGRQQAVSLVGRLSVYFVDCGHGYIVLELEGGGRLWRMFASFKMLEIKINDSYGLNICRKWTLIAINDKIKDLESSPRLLLQLTVGKIRWNVKW